MVRYKHKGMGIALAGMLALALFLGGALVPANGEAAELIVGSVQALRTTDPHAEFGLHELIALRNVWEPLVTIDETGFVPHLATSWSTSEDGLTWTFKLREGVQFADGRPFTAEAVKATFDRITRDSSLGYHFIFLDVEETVVVDDHTVQVKMKAPNGAFLYNLTTVYITPPDVADPRYQDEPYDGKVGTGAFTIVEWQRGRHLILEANPNYWQEGLPKVERLVIRPIAEEVTKVTALRANEIHIGDGISLDSAALLERDPNLKVLQAPIWQVSFVSLNTLKPPLNDPRVRKAISLAIDRELIAHDVIGIGDPIATYPPVGLVGHHDGLPRNPYNVEEARALIQEALPNGHQGRLVLMSRSGPYVKSEEVIQVIAAQLAAIGLNVETRMLEGAAFVDALESGNYDMAYMASIAVTGDPSRFLVERIWQDRFSTGYNNPEVIDLIKRAAQETDLARADQLYREMQEIMYEEPPIVYIYQEYWNVGVRSDVEGFVIPPHRLYDAYKAGFKQ